MEFFNITCFSSSDGLVCLSLFVCPKYIYNSALWTFSFFCLFGQKWILHSNSHIPHTMFFFSWCLSRSHSRKKNGILFFNANFIATFPQFLSVPKICESHSLRGFSLLYSWSFKNVPKENLYFPLDAFLSCLFSLSLSLPTFVPFLPHLVLSFSVHSLGQHVRNSLMILWKALASNAILNLKD